LPEKARVIVVSSPSMATIALRCTSGAALSGQTTKAVPSWRRLRTQRQHRRDARAVHDAARRHHRHADGTHDLTHEREGPVIGVLPRAEEGAAMAARLATLRDDEVRAQPLEVARLAHGGRRAAQADAEAPMRSSMAGGISPR
jgi:hypothetical protein